MESQLFQALCEDIFGRHFDRVTWKSCKLQSKYRKLSNSATCFSGTDVLIKLRWEILAANPRFSPLSVTQPKGISVVARLLSSPQTLYPTSIPLPLFNKPLPIVAPSPCLPARGYASGA